MAGLFELQLPNESRRRRSSDVSHSRHITTRVRSNSPTPEDTAKEIVNQLVAKQQAATLTPASSSSMFRWKRRATGGSELSRPSFDTSSRNSADASSRSMSQSPDGKSPNIKLSPGRAPKGDSAVSSSPRTSSSIDFTLTPSTPGVLSPSAAKGEPKPSPSAASALAQAGLGLGLPPIAFPGPSSPISRHKPAMRKTSGRPGTAHGDERASGSTSSPQYGTVRRVKSFSKHEELQNVGQHRSSGKSLNNAGDVLVFSRERRLSTAPHAYPNLEHSSAHLTLQKGKEREQISDVVFAPSPENTVVARGRQATNQPSSRVGDRDKSATRRAAWWPGRRRLDSSPGDAQPSAVPPPIPMRSQDRPNPSSATNTPLLPSFRPFSPLMGDFRIADSPKSISTKFEDRGDRVSYRLNDPVASLDHGENVVIRRRHSLTNRTGNGSLATSSHVSSHPSSQAYPHPHRHSLSLTSSDHNTPILSPLLPSVSSPSEKSSRPEPPPGPATVTRQRSMTVNSPPVSPPSQPIRETPLLLRHPITRPSSSAGPPDPFLSGWGTSAGIQVDAGTSTEVATLVVEPVDAAPTPSTSSGSTSSLSHSASTNRPPRHRAGTTPPTSRTFATSSTSLSLPPPTSSSRLLRRLSSTFFSSISTPIPSPVDLSATGASSAPYTSNLPQSGIGIGTNPVMSNSSSRGPSKENLVIPDVPRKSLEDMKQKSRKPPIRLSEESPDEYLNRLVETVSKAEVALVLASRYEFCQARRLYSC